MTRQFSQAAFDREFSKYLKPLGQPLVTELQKFMQTPVPPEVGVQLFVVHSDWSFFPVHAFAMDKESPDEVYFESPFYGAILPDVAEIVPEDGINQDEYELNGIATFETGAHVLCEWFGKCWHKAGCAAFPIPAYIHHHDRDAHFDLKAQKWVGQRDIWP